MCSSAQFSTLGNRGKAVLNVQHHLCAMGIAAPAGNKSHQTDDYFADSLATPTHQIYTRLFDVQLHANSNTWEQSKGRTKRTARINAIEPTTALRTRLQHQHIRSIYTRLFDV